MNTKNLATTFGADPLKVSGGVVASYLLIDSSTGAATSGGVLTCNTTLASIRSVQERKWRNKAPMCVDLLAPPPAQE